VGFTASQAKRKAEQIVQRFGSKIRAACAGTSVDPFFVVGFIGVEAGIDRKGNIKESATRFEAGVFQDLKDLRDTGQCVVAGKIRKEYSGVKRSQIQDASDTALRALATSYGLAQIMGWHCINDLHCTIAELRDPERHLFYTVKLLQLVGGQWLEKKSYPAVLRIWNTGSANGKTYHEDYVANALLVMSQAPEIQAWPQITAELRAPEPQPDLDLAARIGDATASTADLSAGGSWALDMSGKAEEPAPVAAAPADPSPKAEAPKEMSTPISGGMKEKVKQWWIWLGLAPPTLTGSFQALKEYQDTGTISIGGILTSMLQVFMFVFPYVSYILISYVGYRILKMVLVQIGFIVRMWILSDPARHDIKLVPPQSEGDPTPYQSGWITKIF
jgi:hypothetical protein